MNVGTAGTGLHLLQSDPRYVARAHARGNRVFCWTVDKPVVVDLGSRAVTRAGDEVRLSPTEYVLLAELARNAGQLMDQRVLLSRVWGPSYAGDRAYLRTFIQRLRRKLEEDPANPLVIVTVGHQGYRFGPTPTALDR